MAWHDLPRHYFKKKKKGQQGPPTPRTTITLFTFGWSLEKGRVRNHHRHTGESRKCHGDNRPRFGDWVGGKGEWTVQC